MECLFEVSELLLLDVMEKKVYVYILPNEYWKYYNMYAI